jgi:hexosaminidase
VAKHGKQVWGWHQLAGGPPVSGALLGYWNSGSQDAEKVAEAVAKHGAKVVMAPADHTYVDMKYDEETELGLKWAGVVDIDKSYEWEPSTHLPGVPADAVVGVEGALWGETVRSLADAEFLMFPRLAAVAEKAWSPEGSRDLAAFRSRVAAQEKRWEAAGVNFAKRL